MGLRRADVNHPERRAAGPDLMVLLGGTGRTSFPASSPLGLFLEQPGKQVFVELLGYSPKGMKVVCLDWVESETSGFEESQPWKGGNQGKCAQERQVLPVTCPGPHRQDRVCGRDPSYAIYC